MQNDQKNAKKHHQEWRCFNDSVISIMDVPVLLLIHVGSKQPTEMQLSFT
jgi:hypothetical protein